MIAPAVRWFGLVVCFSTVADSALAARPVLSFDFARTAECREVSHDSTDGENDGTDEAFSLDRQVELKLRVSAHLLSGNIHHVQELRFEVYDCDSRLRVVSFSPSTRLESRLSEDVTVTTTSETGKTFGASLGGEAPVPLGDVVAHVLPSVNGGLTHREVVTEKRVQRAPQYAVVASGTTRQEHGVLFKLRASPQATLEGAHELTVRFEVPAGWRGDTLRVCCQATGEEKFLWTKQPTTWSSKCDSVAIYLEGDRAARSAAEQFVSADRTMGL